MLPKAVKREQWAYFKSLVNQNNMGTCLRLIWDHLHTRHSKKNRRYFFCKCRKRNATYFLQGHVSGFHILTHGFVFKFLKVQKFF